MSDRKQTGRGFAGKGYYIALILCAAAIGISGYLYYRNQSEPKQKLQSANVQNVQSEKTDVPVIATKPVETTAPTEPPTTVPATEPQPMKTAAPVEGQTVTVYAMDELTYNQTTRDWRVHNGIDIAAEAGTEVHAAAAGVVYTTYDDETMGTTVVIRHDGDYLTRYASLSPDLLVKAGDKVELGQAIGTVGQTALMESALDDHVHFSVSCRDLPVDPMEFLNSSN